MVEEAWAGVVSGTRPTVVDRMLVELMSEVRVVEVFGVGELEESLAGMMEGIERGVVAGSCACVVPQGWGGLLGGGEGFERLVEAALQQLGGAREEQAGASLHQPGRWLPAEIHRPG